MPLIKDNLHIQARTQDFWRGGSVQGSYMTTTIQKATPTLLFALVKLYYALTSYISRAILPGNTLYFSADAARSV